MDIEKIAGLARLKLKTEESQKFAKQIDDILKYVNKLDELPEADLGHGHLGSVRGLEDLREDKVGESLDIKNVLQNAPDKKEDYFKVKGILEGK